MEIKVLGTGCAGCKILHETVKQAVAELKLAATVVKEEDIMKIMRKLSLAEVKELLTK